MSLGNQPAAPELAPVAGPMSPRNRGEPLRVCHIDSGDLWAGAEVNTTTLLKALARKPELQLSAILLNEGEMARRLRNYGIEVCVIAESEHGLWGIYREAVRFLSARSVRILHGHRYKENLLAALLARRCHIPHFVCARHGAPEPFRGWSHVKHNAVTYMDEFVSRHFADRVISLSDELRTQLLHRLPSEKVVTIRTGIDVELVHSALSQTEAKRRLGLPERCRVVGYAGRLVPVKRLDILLHAAKQMSEVEPSVVFVIAGEGPEESGLQTLARELHLEERVHFLGFRDRIYDVMRAFDLFVLCSDHEGLPRCILEALQLGVPVVARPVGGIPEVIQDGVNGVLTDDPDSIAPSCLHLLAEEDRRRMLADNGKRQVSTLMSSETTAEEMAALYEALAGRDFR